MKERIVRRFLKEGILLSPEALEKITEKSEDSFLEQARKSGQAVFSVSEGLTFEVRKIQRKQKITPKELAEHYNRRLEGIKPILIKKIEAVVSVANARKSFAPVATIGMVRESTQRGFIIEDTTGEAEVVSKEEVPQDDVIGVKGSAREGKIFASEIVWPDIPLSNTHTPFDLTITLSGKAEHEDGDFLITPDAVSGIDKKKTTIPNPGWISITKDGLQATVLVYNPRRPVQPKEVFSWLKKRHLSPEKSRIRSTDDPFVIDPVPSLIWIVSPEKWSERYKGVILISSDGSQAVAVNLRTGETIPEKLS